MLGYLFYMMLNWQEIVLIGLFILSSTYAVEYNIALNKIVTTSNNVPDHLATMANDQDLNTYVHVNSEFYIFGWILFDLKGVYNITKIIIWPTNDEDYSLARVYSYVRLTNDTAHSSNAFCSYLNPISGVSYNCSKNNNLVKGRYVLLKKESTFATEDIKIAEVAILTENAEDTEYSVPITAQVKQSHFLNLLPNYDATKAIDGDPFTCIWTGQEAEANRIIPGWWSADLGDDYQVTVVTIFDKHAEDLYRGDYSVSVARRGSTERQLCSVSNTKPNYFNCDSFKTGRYLTVEKMNRSDYNRPDALTFCEIQVVAVLRSQIYTLPIDYNNNPKTTSPNKISPPTSPTLISTSGTCSNDCYSCQQKIELLEKEKLSQIEKIVIGVVVGVLAIIFGIILGFVCGNAYQKKKIVRPTEATVYERPKIEGVEHHVYSDINNTLMSEIHTYDTVIQ